MPATTRAAAQQRAAGQHNEAAMPLPREVVGLVAAWLPPRDWLAFRLASKQLEAALAPHITRLRAPRLPSTSGRLRVRPGLRHVATLDVPAPAGAKAWRALQQATVGLPQLRHLRVGGLDASTISGSVPASVAASWADSITWLELQAGGDDLLPAGVQLRALRVLRVNCFSCIEVSSIEAFAPHLEQLSCDGLNLAASDAAVLGALTHLDAFHIQVAGVAGKAEGMAALACALPRVTVLVNRPMVVGALDAWRALLHDVLAALPAVTAVRGDVADVPPQLSAASAQRIEHLVVSMRSVQDGQQVLQALCHMSRLASLSLVPAHTGATSFAGPQLLQALASLPALQCLVLPATALCDVCCSGVHAALPGLACSTSLVSLKFVAVYGRSRDERFACDHVDSRAAGAGVVCAAAAKRGVALQRLGLQEAVQSSMLAVPGCFFEQVAAGAQRGDSVWGAFGPARDQV